MAALTHAIRLPAKVTLIKEPANRLPAAGEPPKSSLLEVTKSPEKAVVGEKASAPTTPQIKVTFALLEPEAKQVSLCGDFNGWASHAMPMSRHEGGHWEATLELAPGRYEYKFLVDGQWMPDTLAHENVWNPHGTLNSVIEVRA